MSEPHAATATLERVVIPVTGMTCAACQSRVQRTLTKVPGVGDASVNLMLGNASVAFDPSATSVEQLVESIRATGYGADLPAPDRTAVEEQEALDRTQEEEFTGLRRKAIVAGVIGVIAMILSMPLMAAGAGSVAAHGRSMADPFMRWAMLSVEPALRAVAPWLYAIPSIALTYLLLVLTLVVMAWAGRHFYVRAWKAFTHHSADMNTLVAVGTGAAFVYSLVATVAPGIFISRGVAPDVYYEAVVIIIALVSPVTRSRRAPSAARPPPFARSRTFSPGRRGSRAGARRTRPRSTCRSNRCALATSSSCVRASACPWTACSSPAAAPWTSPWSPANRCPSRRTPAIASSAAR